MTDTVVSTIAEGLDECVGGSGWGPKHQAAASYANAAPLLLAVCRAIAALPAADDKVRDLARCAIAAAEGELHAPAVHSTLAELQVVITGTLITERGDLAKADPPKANEFVQERTRLSATALENLAELFPR